MKHCKIIGISLILILGCFPSIPVSAARNLPAPNTQTRIANKTAGLQPKRPLKHMEKVSLHIKKRSLRFYQKPLIKTASVAKQPENQKHRSCI